jgi:hypothetical protein
LKRKLTIWQRKHTAQCRCGAVKFEFNTDPTFVAVCHCLDYKKASGGEATKYGFETSIVGKLREGLPITWTFFLEDGSFKIENYFLDTAIHEQALRSAGFREIRWHKPRLSPEGEATYGRDF